MPLVVLSFLPQSPQSSHKGRKEVSVFITRLIPYKQIPTIQIRAPCGQRWLFRLLCSQFRFLSENFSPCLLWILCGFIIFTTKFAKQAQSSPRGICIYHSLDSIFQQSNVSFFLYASSNFFSFFLSRFHIFLRLGVKYFIFLQFSK